MMDPRHLFIDQRHTLLPRALICMKDLCIYQNVLYRGKGLAR